MTAPDLAQPPPFSVLVDASVAAADLSRLLSMDVMWTEAEKRRDSLDGDDRTSLANLGEAMAESLDGAERHAERLEDLFTSYGQWVNERVRTILDSDRFTPEQREGIRRVLGVDQDDDFAHRGAVSAARFRAVAEAERVELARKVGGLRGSGPVQTDLSHAAACGIAGSALVAEIVLCPETAGLGCAAALVIYLEMEIAHC